MSGTAGQDRPAPDRTSSVRWGRVLLGLALGLLASLLYGYGPGLVSHAIACCDAETGWAGGLVAMTLGSILAVPVMALVLGVIYALTFRRSGAGEDAKSAGCISLIVVATICIAIGFSLTVGWEPGAC